MMLWCMQLSCQPLFWSGIVAGVGEVTEVEVAQQISGYRVTVAYCQMVINRSLNPSFGSGDLLRY